MKTFKKELTGIHVKSASTPSADQLAAINKFTRRPYAAEELYTLKLMLAHNGIDRDNERFPEAMLKDFADSGVGKGLLTDHGRSVKSARGLFFCSEVVTMTPAEFKAMSGEDIVLPDGVKEAHVLSMDAYIPKDGIDEKELALIDAGVIRFGSIGFGAGGRKSATDGKGAKYEEYTGKGTMREGSLVWLGAQPGAIVKDAGGDDNDPPSDGKKEDEKDMDIFAKIAAMCGKKIKDEDGALDYVKELMDEVKTLKEEVTTLKAFAEDGKAHRKSLVDEAVRLSALVGDCDKSAEAGKKEAEFLSTWPLDRLKSHVTALDARARKEHPTEFSLPAHDTKASGDRGTTGESPIVADAKKRKAAAAASKKG